MHPYRALFEQSGTPLFVVERSAPDAMNVYANAAFRRVVGWAADNSEMALANCFPLDVTNVLAAVQACDQQQAVQELMVTWADASRRWQLQLSPVVDAVLLPRTSVPPSKPAPSASTVPEIATASCARNTTTPFAASSQLSNGGHAQIKLRSPKALSTRPTGGQYLFA